MFFISPFFQTAAGLHTKANSSFLSAVNRTALCHVAVFGGWSWDVTVYVMWVQAVEKLKVHIVLAVGIHCAKVMFVKCTFFSVVSLQYKNTINGDILFVSAACIIGRVMPQRIRTLPGLDQCRT